MCIWSYLCKKMNQTIAFTFYDVTTLYFESESEDDLRRIGFSKEKTSTSSNTTGIVYNTTRVSIKSFEVYEGNKYEGQTLLILKKFQDKFQ